MDKSLVELSYITTIKESFHVWIKVASIIYSIQTVLTYGKAKEQHVFVDSFTRLNKAQDDIKFISDFKKFKSAIWYQFSSTTDLRNKYCVVAQAPPLSIPSQITTTTQWAKS